jgi:hypothetical protein
MAEWSAAGHVTLTVVPLERAHVGEYVRMMSATGEQAAIEGAQLSVVRGPP